MPGIIISDETTGILGNNSHSKPNLLFVPTRGVSAVWCRCCALQLFCKTNDEN